jgi:hypothetical protein
VFQGGLAPVFSSQPLSDSNLKICDSGTKVFALKSLWLIPGRGGSARLVAGDLAHIALADIGAMGFFSA